MIHSVRRYRVLLSLLLLPVLLVGCTHADFVPRPLLGTRWAASLTSPDGTVSHFTMICQDQQRLEIRYPDGRVAEGRWTTSNGRNPYFMFSQGVSFITYWVKKPVKLKGTTGTPGGRHYQLTAERLS